MKDEYRCLRGLGPPAARGSQRLAPNPRNRRRSGDAILEGVFTILPTFALIFAFVDFGLVSFRWATLQNAVREGCRYAITFQSSNGQGQDASVEAPAAVERSLPASSPDLFPLRMHVGTPSGYVP
jgi:TadE-like protein